MTWLNPWRVQRRPSPKPRVRRFIPRLEPLERRDVPAVTYGGGALLQNVEAQAIYYGSQWTNNSTEAAESGRFEGFLQYVVNSPYMDMLTNAGYDVGRGSWNQGVVSEANLPNGSTLADATIQSTIQSYISSGSVQNWNADRLYVVFVQAGVVVTSGAGSSRNEPNGFVGYHNSFAGRTAQGGAAQIRYAVVVTPGGGYNGYSSTLPTFDQMTSIASHELAEAVTDPDLNNGWRDYRTGNEIGDVFANDDVYLNHYVVQTEAGLGDNPIVPFTETFAAGEFAGDGVWRYSSVSGWRQLTTANASVLDADANGDVVGDFPGAGVYRYEDATGWVQLTPADASQIAMSGAGIVLAEFPGDGVWRYDDARGGWQQLTGANASQVAVDLYGNAVVELPGQGVWRYDDFFGWKQLTPVDASLIAIGDNGVVGAEFAGQGVWRYGNDGSGWRQLTTTNASQVGVDAVGNVVGAFPGDGVWRYEDVAGWIQLTSSDANGVATGAVSEVIISINGNGLWLYEDGAGWFQITGANPYQFAIGA